MVVAGKLAVGEPEPVVKLLDDGFLVPHLEHLAGGAFVEHAEGAADGEKLLIEAAQAAAARSHHHEVIQRTERARDLVNAAAARAAAPQPPRSAVQSSS